MINRLSLLILGRQGTWRLGRSLYMTARGDVANNISNNGELIVQRSVVDGWRQTSCNEEKLVVFDVGANVGDWSEPFLNYVMSSLEPSPCDLHMFEPVPDTLAMLQGRLVNTDKSTVLHYHQVALSSTKGNEQMFLLGASGINSIHSSSGANKVPSISILKETAIDFCTKNAIKKIHLLKCDTEGHDMEVILGAVPLLKQDRINVLQFEYNHCWIYSRHYLKDVFDVIGQLPYKLGKIQSDHIELYEEWHPEMERYFEANYLLIHNNYLPWFKTIKVVFDEFNTAKTINLT